MPKKPPAQLELFAGAGDARRGKRAVMDSDQVHALGLLGWRDPVWTQQIEIPLCGGSRLRLRLIDIRALHEMVRRRDPDSPGTAVPASNPPNQS